MSIFPDVSKRLIVGLINIIAMKCIWQARLVGREPDVRHFNNLLTMHYETEKVASKMGDSAEKWRTKWEGLHQTTEDSIR